jgi:hypothetical protein
MAGTALLARDATATGSVVATRTLLAAGVVAGPVFLGAVLAQAAAHDDFDLRRHPLSSLALGDAGWVQTATFLVTGLLLVAYAAGLRRRLRPGLGGTWAPVLVAVNGLALVVAGLFAGDPVNGYPVGAAEETTVHGVIHAAAPTVGGLAGWATFLVLARRYAAQGRRRWALLSVALVPVDLVLSGAGAALGDFRLMLAALALSYAWLAAVALDLLRDGDAATTRQAPWAR